MKMSGRAILWCVAAISATAGHATEYSIDPGESVFAVVVHKAGIAARFAHNHLVYPETYTASLTIENADPATAQFALTFPTSKLLVDTSAAHAKWYPGIEKAAILDQPFSALNDGDRKAIAEHMLAKGQLDAEQYPEISAKVKNVRAEASTQGNQTYTHIATLDFTVHGKTIEKECPASIVIESEHVTIDAMGKFAFSEFGIKPFSAMLGAVRNADAFHVFVHIAAKAKP